MSPDPLDAHPPSGDPSARALADAACADADPCTLDFFSRALGRCAHSFDPYCTRPCDQDADCAVDPDVDPCVASACAEGWCSFTALAPAECARCAADADCPGTPCAPQTCAGGRCAPAPGRACDDGDPSTWDRCAPGGDACEHLLGDDLRACADDGDCATDHPCERFACADGRCRVRPETAGCGDLLDQPRTCERPADCVVPGSTPCVAGDCNEGFCEWREVHNSPACAPCDGDHACEGSFCRWPVCTGSVCVLEDVPFCLDDDPETVDLCDEDRAACLHPRSRTPATCARPPEDDRDPGTVDLCEVETGRTLHLPAAGPPCEPRDRCVHGYVGPDGWCLAEPVRCLDDNACGARCDPDRGCVIDDAEACACQSDADCDLGNPCALVVCMGVEEGRREGRGGSCWGTLIDDCVPCSADADCVVDDWCIEGRCAANGTCDYGPAITCEDGDPRTVGFCHGHKDRSCTHEPVLRHRRGGTGLPAR